MAVSIFRTRDVSFTKHRPDILCCQEMFVKERKERRSREEGGQTDT